ncbi:MAG: sulfotransferase [Acidimicrobiales bacterium]|nr:sulfotransferase [Acidimicrobiales bacterium]
MDFFVIGAQKSGTTSLFEVLRSVEEVRLPRGKELPILLDENLSDAEIRSIFTQELGAGSPDVRRGTISPQYLTSPLAAQRIKSLYPDARLVVILRDPLERAISHYKMSSRRGIEQRDFATAVAAELRAREQGLDVAVETAYVSGGCYGEHLRRYLDPDSAKKREILVLRTDDLSSQPEATYRTLLAFLDLEDAELGADPSVRANVDRQDGLAMRALRRLRKMPSYKALVRHVPPTLKHRVAFQIEQRSARPAAAEAADSIVLPPSLHTEVLALFAQDARRIQALTGATPPWLVDGESQSLTNR